jgi:hypothetical protein
LSTSSYSLLPSKACARSVLEEVQAFLEHLQGRRRVTLWLLAAKDKERFAELNMALDRALAVFRVRLSSIEVSSNS